MDEGVAQLFTLEMNNRKIIGTVGALQYEVIQYKLNTNMVQMYLWKISLYIKHVVKPDDAKKRWIQRI
jgi:peptide chain release factor 3